MVKVRCLDIERYTAVVGRGVCDTAGLYIHADGDGGAAGLFAKSGVIKEDVKNIWRRGRVFTDSAYPIVGAQHRCWPRALSHLPVEEAAGVMYGR